MLNSIKLDQPARLNTGYNYPCKLEENVVLTQGPGSSATTVGLKNAQALNVTREHLTEGES